MKKFYTVLLFISALMIAPAYSQDSNFIQELIKSSTMTPPATLEAAEKNVIEADILLTEAMITFFKDAVKDTAKAEELEATLGSKKTLDEKITALKDQLLAMIPGMAEIKKVTSTLKNLKKELKSENKKLAKLQKSCNSDMEAFFAQPNDIAVVDLGNPMLSILDDLSQSVIRYVKIAEGMPKIIDNIKSKGKSPEVVKLVGSANNIRKSVKTQVENVKLLTTTTVTYMEKNKIAVPPVSGTK